MTYYFLSESHNKQLFHVLVCLATCNTLYFYSKYLVVATLIFLSWLAVAGVCNHVKSRGSNLVLKGHLFHTFTIRLGCTGI